MSLPISTAGVTVKYAVETTAGTMPTSGFTGIPGITNIGSINPEPNMLDCTELTETIMHRYINGLRDLGGAIGLTANLTSDFITAWGTLKSAADTAYAAGKATWFEIYSAKLGKSFYVSGMPVDLGFDETAVDQVLHTTAYITPNGWGGYATSST